MPPVEDPRRRARCRRNFGAFCRTYFPEAFSKPWSEDHEREIALIEEEVLKGGLFAIAMPRGNGKTTLAERAVLWALLYGHRRYPVLIGATLQAATSNLDHLKVELEHNELLLAD